MNKEKIKDILRGTNSKYQCHNPYCSSPYSNEPGNCCCGEKRTETKVFNVNIDDAADKIVNTLVGNVTKRLTAEDGNYKKFPIKEALEMMSDEWIDEGEYCAQDLVDLRDILKRIIGI
jgi:hypothetical protein